MRDHSDDQPWVALYLGFCPMYYHVSFSVELLVFVLCEGYNGALSMPRCLLCDNSLDGFP